MSPSRHVLLSSMKDEGPFILEFVAHHLVLGFDAIHIASNDCSDGTDLLLDALAAGGAITHTRNPVKPGEIPQHRAYQRLRRRQPLQGLGDRAVGGRSGLQRDCARDALPGIGRVGWRGGIVHAPSLEQGAGCIARVGLDRLRRAHQTTARTRCAMQQVRRQRGRFRHRRLHGGVPHFNTLSQSIISSAPTANRPSSSPMAMPMPGPSERPVRS